MPEDILSPAEALAVVIEQSMEPVDPDAVIQPTVPPAVNTVELILETEDEETVSAPNDEEVTL